MTVTAGVLHRGKTGVLAGRVSALWIVRFVDGGSAQLSAASLRKVG